MNMRAALQLGTFGTGIVQRVRVPVRLRSRPEGNEAVADTWFDVVEHLAKPGAPRYLIVHPLNTVLVRRVLGEDNDHQVRTDWGSQPTNSGRHTPVDSNEFFAVVPGALHALELLRSANIEIRFRLPTSDDQDEYRQALRSLQISRNSLELELPKSIETDQTATLVGYDEQTPLLAPGSIDVIRFRLLRPNRFEDRFASSGVVGGIVAGASRLARVQARSDQASEGSVPKRDRSRLEETSTLIELGTSVAGCSIVSFILWTRQQCRSRAISQVAYCARDGELPMRIAAALPEGYWPEQMPVYLQGNRKSWTVAGIAALGVNKWLETGTQDPSMFAMHGLHEQPLSELLARIGLSAADIPGDLRLSKLDASDPVPRDEVAAWHSFLDDQRVCSTLQAHGDEQLHLIEDYLSSIGISSGRWALVDVGWRGQLASMVSATVERVCGEAPLTLHLGATSTDPALDRLFEVSRFAFDDESRKAPFKNIVVCVENITGSGAERASGFERAVDGQVVPIMAVGNPEIATAGRQLLWDSAVRVAQHLPPANGQLARYLDDVDGLADPAGQVFSDMWLRPTVAEARTLGAFQFELDSEGKVLGPIAMPYTVSEFIRRSSSVSRQWRVGSLAVTPLWLRAPLRLAEAARSIVVGGEAQVK